MVLSDLQGRMSSVTDTRFTTVFDNLDDLLSGVDLDEVGDIETLLMFLFARPVRVDEVRDSDGDTPSVEVILSGNAETIGSVFDFPMSVLELVRSSSETVAELGPHTGDGPTQSEEARDVAAMTDSELISALQQALGGVRVFNVMDDSE